ncbi:MAG TPA: HAMP domain-containing sensor histidine kinase [Gemmatimonadales bacterium]
MSFRARLFIAFSAAVVLPLALLAWGVRREVDRRLTDQYRQRVDGAVASLEAELAGSTAAVEQRLAALADRLADDNRFRLAVRGGPGARRELLDWGVEAARLSGLALLELQDSSGRILASGHFRNEYDLRRPELPRFLEAVGASPALVRARMPEGSVVALAATASFAVAGQRFALTGGLPFGDDALTRLAPDPQLSVRLAAPGSVSAATGESAVGEVPIPFLDLLAADAAPDTARLVVLQSDATLAGLRRGMNAWFAGALAGAVALGLGLAAWLAARVSRPLRELAERTEAIDLDSLDQDFASDRNDEIGTLSRLLGAMTGRLRAGATRLREAERRVAMGDLARQVNHDIKNGLVPIRNVLRHLDEVAPAPATLAEVYAERRTTLESSVAYLETLARNYARLTPGTGRERCDVNAVVHEVVRAVPPGRAAVRAAPGAGVGTIEGDRVALRRIVENLVGNAVDSVSATGGEVEVATATGRRDGGEPVVRIIVADAGPGMTRAELDRAFDDFYTTKEGGTGLGLSIVRRLVLDLGGALRVDTGPGEGTRVTVELPTSAPAETR